MELRRAGGLWTATAVIGVVTGLGIYSPKSDVPPAQPKITEKSKAKSTEKTSPALDALEAGPCADLERLLQAFLLTKEDVIAAPNSCYQGTQPPKALLGSDQLQYVIAILPDPLHTHLPLTFDRDAQAIQEAAQDGGYVYDSSWLPWETEEATYSRIEDQDKTDERKRRREDQPGLLLFRRATEQPGGSDTPFRDGLVVFVVGEEATAGVHRLQFENAVQ
jgi:hypothetical protein